MNRARGGEDAVHPLELMFGAVFDLDGWLDLGLIHLSWITFAWWVLYLILYLRCFVAPLGERHELPVHFVWRIKFGYALQACLWVVTIAIYVWKPSSGYGTRIYHQLYLSISDASILYGVALNTILFWSLSRFGRSSRLGIPWFHALASLFWFGMAWLLAVVHVRSYTRPECEWALMVVFLFSVRSLFEGTRVYLQKSFVDFTELATADQVSKVALAISLLSAIGCVLTF